MKSRFEDRGWLMSRARWYVRYLFAPVMLCGVCGACADKPKQPSTKPLTMQQRQQKALQDPFGYKLTDEDFPSVTGGGTADLDKKSMKRDMDSFWNP
jgi:hypothetical protein